MNFQHRNQKPARYICFLQLDVVWTSTSALYNAGDAGLVSQERMERTLPSLRPGWTATPKPLFDIYPDTLTTSWPKPRLHQTPYLAFRWTFLTAWIITMPSTSSSCSTEARASLSPLTERRRTTTHCDRYVRCFCAVGNQEYTRVPVPAAGDLTLVRQNAHGGQR